MSLRKLWMPAITALLVCPAMVDAAAAVVTPTDTPTGMQSATVQWLHIETERSGTMLAAVARPKGTGPFPLLILLHGTHGFAPEYVRLAEEVARGGVLAMAPCWFSGGGGTGSKSVSAPIACPDASAMPMAPSQEALRIVTDIVAAARSLPEVRSDRIGLFGHSRGAGASLNYITHAHDVRAAILDSSGYAQEFIEQTSDVSAAVLILHRVKDAPADGGSPFTRIDKAREYEAAARNAGVRVQAHYFPTGEHNGLFSDRGQHADTVRRITRFLQEELK